jgi:hypothetical protein
LHIYYPTFDGVGKLRQRCFINFIFYYHVRKPIQAMGVKDAGIKYGFSTGY